MLPSQSVPIAVDTWRGDLARSARVYFLSHMHADHTAGLTKNWDLGPIYTSNISKKLLIHKLGVEPSLIHGMEYNTPTLIPLDDSDEPEYASAILFDANHCLGSAMILITGKFGNILHTGDFRYTPAMLDYQDGLLRQLTFERLFLDNTYADPVYNFPSQEEALRKVKDIISRYQQDNIVYIGMDTLGKEEMLIALAQEFETLIVVDEKRKALLDSVDMGEHFTTEEDGRYPCDTETQLDREMV